MKMIWCRGAAFRPIIKDRPAGTKIGQELKEGLDRFINGLKAMVYMGDGEVRRKNRHRIAKDQVIAPVEDPSLSFGEMIHAKETLPLPYIFFTQNGRAAFDSVGIVLEADRESLTG